VVVRIVACLVGLALVAAGLVLSPAPWLAPLVVGAVLVAAGLLVDGGDA